MTQLLIPHSLDGRTRRRPGAVVQLISPAPRDIWRGVLRDDPGATALQSPEFFDAVVSATGGRDVSRFYQLRDGRQLVLPLVRRTGLGLRVDRSYPLGYSSGGMLATGGLLADDVRLVLRDLRGDAIGLRVGGAHHTSEQWAAGVRPGVTEERRRVRVLDLEPCTAPDLDTFRAARFGAETSQRLQRAARLGVEMEKDTTGRLIPVFYDIYRSWLEREQPRSGWRPGVGHRSARRAEPYAAFAAVAEGLGEGCRVFVARFRGRPVAATILLVHGQHAVAWRSGRIGELSDPIAADLLTRVTTIEDAVRSGCRDIDLGPWDRGRDTNPLGASLRAVVDLRIEPTGLARLRAARAQVEGLVRALTRTPASPTSGQPTP